MPLKSLEEYYRLLAIGKILSQDEKMQLEYMRIASFDKWPKSINMSSLKLAKAGFYYIGDGKSDTVRCFSCRKALSDWEGRGDPTDEHKKVSPDCSFVSQIPSSKNKLTDIPLKAPFPNLNELKKVINFNTIEHNESEPQTPDDRMDSSSSGVTTPTSSLPGARAPTPPVHDPVPIRPAEREPPNMQQIISNILPTHRISHIDHELKSTDPRRNGDMQYQDRMRSEKERQASYYDFPRGAQQRPEALAAAGFFYTGSADRTQCAFCRGILRNWEPTDDPMAEHRRYFPECPYVLGREVGNIPATRQLQTPVTEPSSTQSIFQTPPVQPITTMAPVSQRHSRPLHINMADVESRLATFTNWPQDVGQSPRELAEAGFYYSGTRDNVRCFHCDGGLTSWEPKDLPWVEHAYWFPRCGFVRNVKGDQYIREIQQAPVKPSRQNQNQQGSSQTFSEPSGPATQHPIEPREVKARLDTPIVRKVIEMGYSMDIIKQVIENQLTSTGGDFPSADKLLDAIFALEEAINRCPTSTQQSVLPSRNPEQPPDNTTLPRTQERSQERSTLPHIQASAPTSGSSLPPHIALLPIDSHSSEIQDLIREHEALKDQRLCRVCMDQEASVVFLPCAHLCCCNTCAPKLRNCPICRQAVRGTVRIYLP